MNPKFKWLLLGAGALVLLLVMLVVFASCRAASDADRRAEALAEQLKQAQNATPVPTATVMPSATAMPTPEQGAIEPQLPDVQTVTPTPEAVEPVEPLVPTVQPTVTPKPATQVSATKKPAATAAPVATGESTVSVSVAQDRGFAFGLPAVAYTDTAVQVRVLGEHKSVTWTLYRDGGQVSAERAYSGTLGVDGGYITFREGGLYTLVGVNERGDSHRTMIRVYPLLKIPFTVPASTYRNAQIEVRTGEDILVENQQIVWSCVHRDGSVVDVSAFTNDGGTLSLPSLGAYTIRAKVTDPRTNRVFEAVHKVTVVDRRPNAPEGAAVVTAERIGNGVKVQLSAAADDPDSDEITLEWSGRTENDIYPAGQHTVRVRARDSVGDVSQWMEVAFEVPNTPPEKPVGTATIHRDNVRNRMAHVTFAAEAVDPDGDPVTYAYLKKRYGDSQQVRFLGDKPICPIGSVTTKAPMWKKRTVCNYTAEGRKAIHQSLGINTSILHKLMRSSSQDRSIEFMDNRISLYAAQNGKCAVLKRVLEYDDIHCHHKVPLAKGGTDAYVNLIILHADVHRLVHAESADAICKYREIVKPTPVMMNKINKLRSLAGLSAITL